MIKSQANFIKSLLAESRLVDWVELGFNEFTPVTVERATRLQRSGGLPRYPGPLLPPISTKFYSESSIQRVICRLMTILSFILCGSVLFSHYFTA